MQCIIRRQLNRATLCYKYPGLAEVLANLSDRKQKQLIADSYSFPVLCTQWIDAAGPSRIAKLQLFYELAPQCQNKPKTQRLMKVYPRFVTWLFNDLIAVATKQTHTEL